MAIESLSFPTLAERQRRAEYIKRYIQNVAGLSFIEAVFADTHDDLDIYTVYCGDLDSVAEELFEAEGRTIDCFPDVPVNFRPVGHASVAACPLPPTAREVFRRS